MYWYIVYKYQKIKKYFITNLFNKNYKSYHPTNGDTIVKGMILHEELSQKYTIKFLYFVENVVVALPMIQFQLNDAESYWNDDSSLIRNKCCWYWSEFVWMILIDLIFAMIEFVLCLRCSFHLVLAFLIDDLDFFFFFENQSRSSVFFLISNISNGRDGITSGMKSVRFRSRHDKLSKLV